MASVSFSVRHVATRSELPQTLTQGRAYFIDDEGCIVINHGSGAITYGAKKQTEGNTQNIGKIAELQTSANNNLVAALNEVYGYSKVLKEGSGAGLHNSIFRGKNLGASLTAAQSAAIRAGTFDDVWAGDSWTINVPAYKWTDSGGTEHSEGAVNIKFWIGGCNYRLGCGDQGNGLTTNHVIVFPDTVLYTARMNATNTTDGGYVGSEMYTNNLRRAKALFTAAFGADHILTHRTYLTNAVKNGRPSGGAWVNSTVELMTEQMVYGGKVFGVASDGGETVPYLYTIDKSQLPLFQHRPDLIHTRSGWYWLRDVVNGACFAVVHHAGDAHFSNASHSGGGVRPDSLPCFFGHSSRARL